MSRGGRRAGAGRPFLENPKDKKVQICVTIHPTTKFMIETMKQDGVKIGKIVDEAVKGVFERFVQGADLSNLK